MYDIRYYVPREASPDFAPHHGASMLLNTCVVVSMYDIRYYIPREASPDFAPHHGASMLQNTRVVVSMN